MASKPPSMSTTQKAGSSSGTCPFAQTKNQKKRARQKAAKQKTKPCDLASITVALATKSGGVSKTGTKPVAITKALPNVAPALNSLLQSNAVVIHYVAPATHHKASKPSRQNQVTEINASELKGDATATHTMKSNCGSHPTASRDPADGDGGPGKKELSVETKDWELQALFEHLWGKSSMAELVYGAEEGVTFHFDSCGRPAGGNPVGALSGVVQLAIADEWVGSFRWAEGFRLTFSDETKQIWDKVDGTHVYSKAKEYKDKYGGEATDEFVEARQKGATTYIKGKIGEENYERAKEGAKSLETEIAKRLAKEDDDEDDGSITGKLKKAADFHDEQSLKRGLALKITRNGTDVLDTDGWGEIIENVQDMLKTGSDLLYRLTWLLENGAKAGVPLSLTMGMELDLRLLQGNVNVRAWPEAQPLVQGGSYYIADYKKRYQLGVSATLAKIELTFTLTLQAKILHEWVGALTFEVEAKFSGSSKLDVNFAEVAVPDRSMGGEIGASVTASGEASAASFYLKVEGEAKGGINHKATLGWDGTKLKNVRHKVTNGRVEFQASVRHGNKIWDYIGLGSDEPDWQWPAEEPFVWLKENALRREW